MRFAFLVFILSILNHQNLVAQSEGYIGYITLNFGDCVNCIQPIRKLDKINLVLPTKLIVREKDKAMSLKYLREELKVAIDKSQIIYSDSMFRALNSKNHNILESSFHVLWKNEVLKSFQLKSFTDDDLLLVTNLSINRRRMLLSDSVFSNNIILRKYNDKIFILDKKFNNIKKVNIVSLKEEYSLYGRNIDRRLVYKEIFGDTINFFLKIQKYDKELSEYGKDKIEIISLNVLENDKVFLEFCLYYVIETNKEIGIHPVTIVAELHSNNELTFYKIKKLPEYLDRDGYYGLLTDFVLASDGKSFSEGFTMLANSKPDTNRTFFIAKINFSKNKGINFIDFSKLKYPSFALSPAYMFVGGAIKNNLYFFKYENLYGDLRTGKYSKLVEDSFSQNFIKIRQGTQKMNYIMYDVLNLDENNFAMLLFVKGEFRVLQFNKVSKDKFMLRKILLPYPQENKEIISDYIFLDDKRIIAIGSGNELLEFSF